MAINLYKRDIRQILSLLHFHIFEVVERVTIQPEQVHYTLTENV